VRKVSIKAIGLLSTALLASIPGAPEASAQRGGQHLNSPGYQRALAESRKPKAKPVEPAATVRKKRPQPVQAQ
jgi:hypothetical protein